MRGDGNSRFFFIALLGPGTSTGVRFIRRAGAQERSFAGFPVQMRARLRKPPDLRPRNGLRQEEWTQQFVSQRSHRIAELAYDRLTPWLHL